ncbi:ester cyclase [Acinetobacter equi]|uniref:Polyketide cyclase n=1 Tax=Acinetobacter equi TaxID=1324350 RepID=A0A0N9V7H6_9GAMM|nr:ester cyclase [Acinetobacter equi]ALH95148.1 polyketide cyclase [Acinetobacter equi]
MKKLLLASTLLVTLPILNTVQAAAPTSGIKAKSQTEQNRNIVLDFYQGVFQKHHVKAYADRYIGDQYIQHNPYVSDGKAPFVNYFTQYFKENPTAQNTIKRAITDGDLVVLHVHSKQNEHDKGQAIVDIFRIENGKIVEHWDVIQNIPEQSANQNSMF